MIPSASLGVVRLKKICSASFREICQWLKFPLNGLRAQSRLSQVVGLPPLASGPACLGTAFPPFLGKKLYRCDSVVISSFVRTGYTTIRWGWLLGRISCSITHHYPLYPRILFKKNWRQKWFPCFEISRVQQQFCKLSSPDGSKHQRDLYIQTKEHTIHGNGVAMVYRYA